MKSTILLLCYIATRLTPTLLDLIVQTINAVVVNGMCVAVDIPTYVYIFYVFVST